MNMGGDDEETEGIAEDVVEDFEDADFDFDD